MTLKLFGICAVCFLITSTEILAFGGGGEHKDRTRELYKRGVDAIGVHINGDTCADDEELIDGKCFKKCDNGLEHNTDGSCTICSNGNVYLSYMSAPCETETSMTPDSNCKSNKDCSVGEFCNLSNNIPICQKPNDEEICKKPNVGLCTLLDTVTPYIYDGKNLIRSSNHMTWWAAENWCKANNKNLIALASTGMDDLGEYFYEHGCCAQYPGMECQNVDWSKLYQTFFDIFEDENYWWTQDDYSTGVAYFVGWGHVGCNGRRNNAKYKYAMCE